MRVALLGLVLVGCSKPPPALKMAPPIGAEDPSGSAGVSTLPSLQPSSAVAARSPPIFPGEIVPVRDTVALGYAPTSGAWRLRSKSVVEIPGAAPRVAESFATVEIRPHPDGRLLVRETVEPEPGADPVSLEFTLERRGGIRGFEAAGIGTGRTQDRFRMRGELYQVARLQFPSFRQAGYRQGDVVERMSIAQPGASEVAGELVNRLAGETRIDGRRAFVIAGETSFATGRPDDRRQVSVRSYWVMDAATGLAVAGEQLMVVTDAAGRIVNQRYDRQVSEQKPVDTAGTK